ncbi:MAG TPA: GNAT family N-acetyltransferase [Acidimicrobiales bacterium]|nr:GNAT family N-acetyltransferase [Acidimicrobiales bacterium]
MSCVVTKNEDAGRYELHVDGELAGIADYVERDGSVVLPHTVIDSARRGQGLGAVLVQGALDDIRPTGRTVVPSCWYVAEFIDENPSYKDLLAS